MTEKTDPSGYKYMRNRYYSPQTGQFTQQDPIGLAGGVNLYGFADGDPINFSDPSGLCPPEDDEPCGPLQRLANWSAARGNTPLLNIAAGVQALAEAVVTIVDAVGLSPELDCGAGVVCGGPPPVLAGRIGTDAQSQSITTEVSTRTAPGRDTR